MPKNSFILQARLNTIVAKLTDAQAGVLFKGILNYAENGVKLDFDDSGVAMAFEFVKQDIDYNNQKYAEVCARNSSNGKKGGAPKGNSNAQKQPKTSETTQNKRPLEKQPKTSETSENKHNDVDNDVDNDVELLDNISNNNKTPLPPLKEGKGFEIENISNTQMQCECIADISKLKNFEITKRFQKPTVEEIKAYCEERHNGIDAQAFYDFYESKGWKIGNSPMKNWQACVRTWEKRKGAQENGVDYNKQNADTSKYDRIAGHKVYG